MAFSSSPNPRLSAGFIEHPVSKLDTLAGVAIKYGVEVADIRKLNGLVTERQMFALKILKIPLPGRHPPSPCLLSSSDNPRQSCDDQTSQKFSLRDFYGLKLADKKTTPRSFEMAAYKNEEDSPFLNASNPRLSRHRKSKSISNNLVDENGDLVDFEKPNETLVRRRQKSVTDFTFCTPEKLLDDNSGGSGFSATAGRDLALRNKASTHESEESDCFMVDGFVSVRKSSSTSNLQEQESNGSSAWPTTKWSLKSDLQALSSAAIAKPIFDVLPKPISGRKNKAALD